MTRVLVWSVGVLLAGWVGTVAAASKAQEAEQYTRELTNKDPKVRAVAAQKLGELGQLKASFAKPAIPLLVDALKDKDAKVREAAALALGRVDPEPEVAVKPLIELLKSDKEPTAVKQAAAQGLGAIGPGAKEAVQPLRELQGKLDKKKDRALMRDIQAALKTIQERKK